MEALILIFCIYSARYSTIKSFYTWVGKSDQLSFIKNIEHSCLSIVRVYSIQNRASIYTNTTVATILGAQKEQLANLENQPSEPNKLSEIRTTNQDVVRNNVLWLLNYSLLYLDFNDICHKDYSSRVEKCIVHLVLIYQDFHQTRYSMKLIHIVAYMKWILKNDFN